MTNPTPTPHVTAKQPPAPTPLEIMEEAETKLTEAQETAAEMESHYETLEKGKTA